MHNHNGNPNFNKPLRLFSETGYNLTIRPNGVVCGSQDDDDTDSFLEKISEATGQVRIRSSTNNLYLCFNSDGKLYGEADPEGKDTIFKEEFQGSYTGFMSVINPGWYVAIKRSGKAKNGNQTEYGQKAVKFLPRDI